MSVTPHKFPSPESTVGNPIVVATPVIYSINLGRIPGWSMAHTGGRNNNAPNGTEDDVWDVTGILTWLQAAVQMDISSSSINDDATPTTSTGAQSIRIIGLTTGFVEQVVDYDLNGQTIVTTAESWLRINRVYCLSGGTYHGTNAGDITIQVTGGGAVQAMVMTGIGESQKSHYTVPAGKTGLLLRMGAEIDANKPADVFAWQYQNADDVTQPYSGIKRLIHSIPALEGPYFRLFQTLPVLPEKTDIWMSTIAEAAGTAVEGDLDFAISDNV